MSYYKAPPPGVKKWNLIIANYVFKRAAQVAIADKITILTKCEYYWRSVYQDR